jgi:hypothetical protein
VTGAEIDAIVQAEADDLHLLAVHFPDSRRVTARGWVDWVIIGPRGMLFRENKGNGDALSGEQRALGYVLQALGQNWAVWWGGPDIRIIIRSELEAIATPAAAPADS